MQRSTPHPRVLDLIQHIYDAALDANKWEHTLGAIVQALDGRSGNLFVVNTNTNAVGFQVHWGLGEEWLRAYKEHFAAVDPWNEILSGRPLGMVALTHRVLPDNALSKTEFHADFLRHQGIFYACGGFFARFGEVSAMFGAHRPRDAAPFGAKDALLIEQLFPHLRRAFQIQQRLEMQEQPTPAEHAALERLPFGVFLIDGRQQVVFMNGRAENLIRKQSGIALRGRRLACTDSAQSERLGQLLQGAVATGACHGTAAGGMLAVRTSSDAPPIGVLVSPLPTSNRLLGESSARIRAIVFVKDSTEPLRLPNAALRTLYGLTPTQALLLQRLAQDFDLYGAAEQLRMSRETARRHLKEIFRRTGTKKQSELLTLVTTGPAALASQADVLQSD